LTILFLLAELINANIRQMTIRRILQLLSLGLLLYLLADAFMHIEFTASKNNALTAWQKAEIDSIQNIDALKQKAKENLDIIRRIHRSYSNKSVTNFLAFDKTYNIASLSSFQLADKKSGDE
jgi:hypothetical protein